MTALGGAPAAFAAALATHRPGRIIVAEPPGAGIAAGLAALAGAARVDAYCTDAAGLSGVPVLLGADDRDIRAAAQAGWPSGLAPRWFRERRIDTIYAGQPVTGIVLADPALAAAALRGAHHVLAQCRPFVLLRTASGAAAVPPPIPGYRWTAAAGGVAWARPAGDTGATPRLGTPRPAEILVPFDAALTCGGLHPPEPNAPAGGRWTGAATTAWVVLPRPLPGRWRLRLDIADWGNATAGFDAAVDGFTLKSQPDGNTLAYGPIRIGAGPLTLRVALRLPRAEPDQIRWPRRIGVRILRAALLPA